MEAHLKRIAFLLAFLLAVSGSALFAQHKVQMRNMYQRLYLVVPMVGSGTDADPRRPMYAPLPPQRGAEAGAQPAASGIIAFVFQESDDGAYALVEMVARDRSAFSQILADNRPDVKIFTKGVDSKDDIETEFRKHKSGFDLDSLVVNLP
jgi:hypothetical protein